MYNMLSEMVLLQCEKIIDDLYRSPRDDRARGTAYVRARLLAAFFGEIGFSPGEAERRVFREAKSYALGRYGPEDGPKLLGPLAEGLGCLQELAYDGPRQNEENRRDRA